jgi:hypothetical protein
MFEKKSRAAGEPLSLLRVALHSQVRVCDAACLSSLGRILRDIEGGSILPREDIEEDIEGGRHPP